MSVFLCLLQLHSIYWEPIWLLTYVLRPEKKLSMSGLYNNNHNFSPSRAASPQIRTSNPDVDRYIWLLSFLCLILCCWIPHSFLVIWIEFTMRIVIAICVFWNMLVISTCQNCWLNIKRLVHSCKFFPFVALSWIKVTPFF